MIAAAIVGLGWWGSTLRRELADSSVIRRKIGTCNLMFVHYRKQGSKRSDSVTILAKHRHRTAADSYNKVRSMITKMSIKIISVPFLRTFVGRWH